MREFFAGECGMLALIGWRALRVPMPLASILNHDTVRMHVRHILSKLNLSSRVQAAVFTIERKLTAPLHGRSGN